MQLTDKQISEIWTQCEGIESEAGAIAFARKLLAGHNAGAQEPVAWHSIPDTPPVELMEWYGDQFSVPVLLHGEEKILPFVARWSFPEKGWVGAQLSYGPSPYDYEHLNEKHMMWMLLSDVTDCAHPQPMPLTSAVRDAKDAKRWRHIYEGHYVVCRIHKDGTLENLGGGYVGKYAIDAEIERIDRAKGE